MSKGIANYCKYTILDIRNKVKCALPGNMPLRQLREGVRQIDLYQTWGELDHE